MSVAPHNFYAGPGKLPASVLERIRDELGDYRDSGLSVMEISHRAREIVELIDGVERKLRALLEVPDSSAVVLLQGGGSLQFCMVPMNLSQPGERIEFVDTGYWSDKAIAACRSLGREATVIARDHRAIPHVPDTGADARYVHICTNNTVEGTQWQRLPEVSAPIVADMSSDLLSRHFDHARMGLIYAHAQKTLGIAGVTIVVVAQEALDRIPPDLPAFFDYRTHAGAKSNHHTPPVFAIYVLDCMLDWLEHDIGGLQPMQTLNETKAGALYATIDASELFECPVPAASRSRMNIVFDLREAALARRFSHEARCAGLIGLDGHRSRGGFRASLYNAVTLHDVEALSGFLRDFERRHG